MEKKSNGCLLDACEKFFKAITANSPFRINRRISRHHQDSKPANLAPNPIVKTNHSAKHTNPVASSQEHKTPKKGEAGEIVRIKLDDSETLPSATVQNSRKEPISQLARVKKVATLHKAEIAAQAQQKYKHNGDDTPPTTTHAADGYDLQGVKTNGKDEPPRVSRIESNKMGTNMEDKFTDYINRAGINIRTTSSVNGKNNPSSSGDNDSKDNFSDYINRSKNKMLRTMSSFVGRRSDSMK